jgi:hypothetical protein
MKQTPTKMGFEKRRERIKALNGMAHLKGEGKEPLPSSAS